MVVGVTCAELQVLAYPRPTLSPEWLGTCRWSSGGAERIEAYQVQSTPILLICTESVVLRGGTLRRTRSGVCGTEIGNWYCECGTEKGYTCTKRRGLVLECGTERGYTGTMRRLSVWY
eukprot:1275502-Rhodomonas_salina.1